MRALGTGTIARNPRPLLGRTYHVRGDTLMAKLKDAWEGLTAKGTSGTYIRPTFPGYEYGRWTRTHWPLSGDHCRFEKLGDASTVEEAKAGLADADKAQERRVRELNKRRKR